MKKVFSSIIMPMALISITTLTACSSEDMQGDDKGMDHLNIKLSESNYGNDDATRYIMADTYVVDSQRVDLGNGYSAEIVVTKDAAESAENRTRAYGDGDGGIYGARSGNYTVQAFAKDAVDQAPLYTFTGAWDLDTKTFTKNGEWNIDTGNYDFICYKTDGWVAENPNILSIPAKDASAQQLRENALVSDKVNQTIVSGSNLLDFTLKHKASAFRIKVSTNVGTIEGITGTANSLTVLDPNIVHKYHLPSLSCDVSDEEDVRENNWKCTVDNSQSTKTATSEYYYMPNGINLKDLKWTFYGTTYLSCIKDEGDEPVELPLSILDNKVLPDQVMQAGERYTVNINVVPTLYKVTVVRAERPYYPWYWQPNNALDAGDYASAYASNEYSMETEVEEGAKYTVLGTKDGTATLFASPSIFQEENNLFEAWTVDGDTISYDPILDINIKDYNNKTIVAHFLPKWEVLIYPSEVGDASRETYSKHWFIMRRKDDLFVDGSDHQMQQVYAPEQGCAIYPQFVAQKEKSYFYAYNPYTEQKVDWPTEWDYRWEYNPKTHIYKLFYRDNTYWKYSTSVIPTE